MAAEACGSAGKVVIAGLVDCKRHEPRPTADSLDRPRCCSGIRLAQVDEHCTRLGIGDFCDAARAQIGNVDHDKVSATAQCCGQAIPDQMNRGGDDQPNVFLRLPDAIP